MYTIKYESILADSGALEAWNEIEKSHPELKKYESQRLKAEASGDSGMAEALRIAQDEIHAAAVRLSESIFDAMGKSLPAETVLVIGNSTGKDSTAVMGLAANWALSQKKAGERIPKTIVSIADTRSEFPLMAKMMRDTRVSINSWALKNNLPISCHIEEPEVKGRLLVELIGNGKPLPALGSSTGSKGPSNWCMDRVKAKPIESMLRKIQGEGSQFLHVLGTRYAESTKRAATMERHNEGLPYSLGRMKINKGEENISIPNALCFQPIAHWPDWMPFRFLEGIILPWNPFGVEQLKDAYDLASGGGTVTECGLRNTEDGTFTSVCQGLDGSGARMGCWLCFKVKNKSLINMAAQDARFVPLKEFHSHIMQIHKKDAERRSRRDNAGFDKDTLCSKTFLFRERYYMLMLLFKAVEESGFDDLIRDEEVQQIERFWRKHGVFAITAKMAKEDALRWIKTGKMVISWENKSEWINDLGGRLSEGLNLTAYWHVLNPDYDALYWQRILQFTEVPTLLIPRLQTYVFRDWDSDRYTFLVSDCYGPFVTKANKDIIDDLVLPNWQLIHIREPNPFEVSISNGKSIFYTVDAKKTCDDAEQYRRAAEEGAELNQMQRDIISIALGVLETLDYDTRSETAHEDELIFKPLIVKSHFKSIAPDKADKLQGLMQSIIPVIEELNDDFQTKIRQLEKEFPQHTLTGDILSSFRKRSSQIFGVNAKHGMNLDLFDSELKLEVIEKYIDLFVKIGDLTLSENIHPVVIEKLLDHEFSGETNSLTFQSLRTDFTGEEPNYSEILPEVYF